MVDIALAKNYIHWTFQPTTAKGRRWLDKNYHRPEGYRAPLARAEMVVKQMRADGLEVVEHSVEDPHPVYDFDDQYSSLLIARSKHQSGEGHTALAQLVGLRTDVLASTDPKSNALLPEIDREIAKAHLACRTDTHPGSRGSETPAARRWFSTVLSKWPHKIDSVLFRVAISVAFAVHIFRFLGAV